MTADGSSLLPVDKSIWLLPCPHIWQRDSDEKDGVEIENNHQFQSDTECPSMAATVWMVIGVQSDISQHK